MKKHFLPKVVIVCYMAFMSCNKPETVAPDGALRTQTMQTSSIPSTPYREGDLVLGKKLNNPYTLANMKQAISRLESQGLSLLNSSRVRASHYYVKFKPADSAQYEELLTDKRMTVYPYPLDYEIAVRGNRYHDPSLPKGTITYHYAAVKSDFIFNAKIPHEIISALYIPEEDANLTGKNAETYVDRLLDQAYTQTGNYQDTIKADKGKSQKASYYPGGKIQVWDTRLQQYIGLQGVDMRARRWFTTYHARTDFWGNYQMNNTFKRPCNYSLWFSQEDFHIQEHLIGLTAWIDGPKQDDDWNVNIGSGYDRFVSHIFRAAYRYHYGFIDGLKRPYLPIARLKYVAKNDDGLPGNTLVPLPIIKICRYNGNAEYDSDEIFSTTCHETAHSSHQHRMDLLAFSYWTVSTWLQESWAIGVEWWLTKLEYKNTRGIANYGDYDYAISVGYPNKQGYQYWSLATSNKYTNIYINLIDNYNEKGILSTTDDDVNGYTLATIEDNMLHKIFTLQSLREQLKDHKPASVTDADIDKLLLYY